MDEDNRFNNKDNGSVFDGDERGVPPQVQEEIVQENIGGNSNTNNSNTNNSNTNNSNTNNSNTTGNNNNSNNNNSNNTGNNNNNNKQQSNEENYQPNGYTASEPYYHERVKEAPKKKGKPWKKFIAACVIVSFVGGGTMGISLGLTQKYIDSRVGTTTSAVTEPPQESAMKQAVSKISGSQSKVELVKEVKPSVVSISTEIQSTMQSFGGFGMSVPYQQAGAGSGIVFYQDEEKIGIATNNHVIEDANNITVTFADEKSVKASIAGTDSTADLAVLVVNKADLETAGIKDIHVAKFGDSDSMQEGESVLAIGNALGEGITVTDGIVSATGKNINLDGRTLQVIQTNAAINDGNSGGALVNENAEVIGINTAKVTKNLAEGMGYAIPSNTLVPIIEKLLVEGTNPKPYIGIRGVDITDEIAQLYRLKLPVGVLVVEVIPGSSAESAGLQPSDVIIGLNDKNITSMNQLVEVLAGQQIGDDVTLQILRNGETSMDLKVTILDANQQNIQ